MVVHVIAGEGDGRWRCLSEVSISIAFVSLNPQCRPYVWFVPPVRSISAQCPQRQQVRKRFSFVASLEHTILLMLGYERVIHALH